MPNTISVEKVNLFLRDKNLDVRKVGSGRMYDQKVTPDVMTTICSVIVAYVGSAHARADKTFTIHNLWKTPEFNEIVTGVFTKPDAIIDIARHEYDKFIGQPLHVLYHAGILSQEKRGQSLLYTVKEPEWVSLLAHSEENCVVFLWCYIEKMLEESGISKKFANFYDNPNTKTYGVAIRAYIDLFLKHTPINGETEIRRIFAKVMNIPAFKRKTHGTIRGRCSKSKITLSDIRYNQPNWRDIASGKPKDVPRKQYRTRRPAHSGFTQKVVRDVKQHHGNTAEIHDSNEGASVDVDGHHILPKSIYPELSNIRENIIVLTPNQHRVAHGGATHHISPGFQLFCLIRKIDSIEACEKDPNCIFYNVGIFKKMLSALGIPNADRPEHNFDDLRRIIMAHYAQSH